MFYRIHTCTPAHMRTHPLLRIFERFQDTEVGESSLKKEGVHLSEGDCEELGGVQRSRSQRGSSTGEVGRAQAHRTPGKPDVPQGEEGGGAASPAPHSRAPDAPAPHPPSLTSHSEAINIPHHGHSKSKYIIR